MVRVVPTSVDTEELGDTFSASGENTFSPGGESVLSASTSSPLLRSTRDRLISAAENGRENVKKMLFRNKKGASPTTSPLTTDQQCEHVAVDVSNWNDSLKNEVHSPHCLASPLSPTSPIRDTLFRWRRDSMAPPGSGGGGGGGQGGGGGAGQGGAGGERKSATATGPAVVNFRESKRNRFLLTFEPQLERRFVDFHTTWSQRGKQRTYLLLFTLEFLTLLYELCALLVAEDADKDESFGRPWKSNMIFLLMASLGSFFPLFSDLRNRVYNFQFQSDRSRIIMQTILWFLLAFSTVAYSISPYLQIWRDASLTHGWQLWTFALMIAYPVTAVVRVTRFFFMCVLCAAILAWRYSMHDQNEDTTTKIVHAVMLPCAIILAYGRESVLRNDFLTTVQEKVEKAKLEQLLLRMLPAKTIERLLSNELVAEKFDLVTILFAEICDFSEKASLMQPVDLLSLLNQLFRRFDQLTDYHRVFKVESVGHVYMVAGGLPTLSQGHAVRVARLAISMHLACESLRWPDNTPIQCKIGIHSSSVVAGVIGAKLPRYRLFGDTVNTASRMCTFGKPRRIHVSSAAEPLLRHDFHLVLRGEINIKGKGDQTTYWLTPESIRTQSAGVMPNATRYSSFVQDDNHLNSPSSHRRLEDWSEEEGNATDGSGCESEVAELAISIKGGAKETVPFDSRLTLGASFSTMSDDPPSALLASSRLLSSRRNSIGQGITAFTPKHQQQQQSPGFIPSAALVVSSALSPSNRRSSFSNIDFPLHSSPPRKGSTRINEEESEESENENGLVGNVSVSFKHLNSRVGVGSGNGENVLEGRVIVSKGSYSSLDKDDNNGGGGGYSSNDEKQVITISRKNGGSRSRRGSAGNANITVLIPPPPPMLSSRRSGGSPPTSARSARSQTRPTFSVIPHSPGSSSGGAPRSPFFGAPQSPSPRPPSSPGSSRASGPHEPRNRSNSLDRKTPPPRVVMLSLNEIDEFRHSEWGSVRTGTDEGRNESLKDTVLRRPSFAGSFANPTAGGMAAANRKLTLTRKLSVSSFDVSAVRLPPDLDGGDQLDISAAGGGAEAIAYRDMRDGGGEMEQKNEGEEWAEVILSLSLHRKEKVLENFDLLFKIAGTPIDPEMLWNQLTLKFLDEDSEEAYRASQSLNRLPILISCTIATIALLVHIGVYLLSTDNGMLVDQLWWSGAIIVFSSILDSVALIAFRNSPRTGSMIIACGIELILISQMILAWPFGGNCVLGAWPELLCITSIGIFSWWGGSVVHSVVVTVGFALIRIIAAAASHSIAGDTRALLLTCAFSCLAQYERNRRRRAGFIAARTVTLEQERSKGVLSDLIPPTIAQELAECDATGRSVVCHQLSEVSIMFADMVGFTSLSAEMSPEDLVSLLQMVFNFIDELAAKYGVFKVETIGDCYFAASGVPQPRFDHALALAMMALELQETVADFCTPDGKPLQFRVGLHTGTVVGGVVGYKMPRYHLFGEAVQIAQRLESAGGGGGAAVNCTTAFKNAVLRLSDERASRMRFTQRDVTLENGEHMFWLTNRRVDRTISSDFIESDALVKLQQLVRFALSSPLFGDGETDTVMGTLEEDKEKIDVSRLEQGMRKLGFGSLPFKRVHQLLDYDGDGIVHVDDAVAAIVEIISNEEKALRLVFDVYDRGCCGSINFLEVEATLNHVALASVPHHILRDLVSYIFTTVDPTKSGQITMDQFVNCFDTVPVLGKSWLIDPLKDVFKKGGVLQKALREVSNSEIDADVLAKVMTDVGMPFVPVLRLLGAIDDNDDGLIDEIMLKEALNTLHNGGTEAAEICFRIFDAKRCGLIERFDVEETFSPVSLGNVGLTSKLVTALFNRWDQNNDGNITWEVFRTAARREPLLAQWLLKPGDVDETQPELVDETPTSPPSRSRSGLNTPGSTSVPGLDNAGNGSAPPSPKSTTARAFGFFSALSRSSSNQALLQPSYSLTRTGGGSGTATPAGPLSAASQKKGQLQVSSPTSGSGFGFNSSLPSSPKFPFSSDMFGPDGRQASFPAPKSNGFAFPPPQHQKSAQSLASSGSRSPTTPFNGHLQTAFRSSASSLSGGSVSGGGDNNNNNNNNNFFSGGGGDASAVASVTAGSVFPRRGHSPSSSNSSSPMVTVSFPNPQMGRSSSSLSAGGLPQSSVGMGTGSEPTSPKYPSSSEHSRHGSPRHTSVNATAHTGSAVVAGVFANDETESVVAAHPRPKNINVTGTPAGGGPSKPGTVSGGRKTLRPLPPRPKYNTNNDLSINTSIHNPPVVAATTMQIKVPSPTNRARNNSFGQQSAGMELTPGHASPSSHSPPSFGSGMRFDETFGNVRGGAAGVGFGGEEREWMREKKERRVKERDEILATIAAVKEERGGGNKSNLGQQPPRKPFLRQLSGGLTQLLGGL